MKKKNNFKATFYEEFDKSDMILNQNNVNEAVRNHTFWNNYV